MSFQRIKVDTHVQEKKVYGAGGQGAAGGNPDGTQHFILMTYFGSYGLQAFSHPSRNVQLSCLNKSRWEHQSISSIL